MTRTLEQKCIREESISDCIITFYFERVIHPYSKIESRTRVPARVLLDSHCHSLIPITSTKFIKLIQ